MQENEFGLIEKLVFGPKEVELLLTTLEEAVRLMLAVLRRVRMRTEEVFWNSRLIHLKLMNSS
jgi:hypothetical protein